MPTTNHTTTLAVCLIIVIVWLCILTNRHTKQEERMADLEAQVAELTEVQRETQEAITEERAQVRAELDRLANIITELENANQQPNVDLSGPIAEGRLILANLKGIYEPAAQPRVDPAPDGEDGDGDEDGEDGEEA